jgi:hypothetical protein
VLVFVTVMQVRPMRMGVDDLVVLVRVRVARRGRLGGVRVVVVRVVVPMAVDVLDRRMAMRVAVHAAEQQRWNQRAWDPDPWQFTNFLV